MLGPIRARARFAIASFTLALALSACGDDDPTGPNGGNADLVGEWDYVISDATGVGVNGVCSLSSITLTFTNNGTLAGTATANGDDNLVCVSGSTTTRTVSGTSSLQNLTVNGSSIEFELRDLSSAALSSAVPIVSTGSVTGNASSMGGTVTFTMRFSSSGGVVTRPMTGSWTATRR